MLTYLNTKGNIMDTTAMYHRNHTNAEDLLIAAGIHESTWGVSIIEAETRGHFAAAQTLDADDWFSCACGKLDGHIEKDGDGGPKDKQLNELGVWFSVCVRDNFFIEAATTLIAIEARSIALLNETA